MGNTKMINAAINFIIKWHKDLMDRYFEAENISFS